MFFIKKLVFLALAAFLVFAGVWLVVVNDQTLSLNLIFWSTPALNVGFLAILIFTAGTFLGLLLGFNLLRILKLNNRLYWLRREVRQLQEALHEHRDPS